jgi:hypothetical protein
MKAKAARRYLRAKAADIARHNTGMKKLCPSDAKKVKEAVRVAVKED